MSEAAFQDKQRVAICLLYFFQIALLGLYYLFISWLLHSLFYPWQFTFSFIGYIIHISLSHPFLEIAVQPLVLLLIQCTNFFVFCSVFSHFPIPIYP